MTIMPATTMNMRKQPVGGWKAVPEAQPSAPVLGRPTVSAGEGPNEAFELWWKDTFGEPKNANQAMTKSVAFHAWTAGQSKAQAAHTKEVMMHAVTKFELQEGRKKRKICTCPESQWIGSEPNDSTCELSEEEHNTASSQEALREMTANYNTLLDEVVRLGAELTAAKESLEFWRTEWFTLNNRRFGIA